jgi:cardiolipin synthase
MRAEPAGITDQYKLYNHVALVQGGKEYFEKLLELIATAEYMLHVQVYIFEADSTGTMVANALIDAVAKGVKVFVIADGYASSKFFDTPLAAEMKQAGIMLRRFEPFFKSKHYYFGRRLHHKVVVADAQRALVGGINIADKYNDVAEDPAWIDYALYVEGEVPLQLEHRCREVFRHKYFRGLPIISKPHKCDDADSCSVRVRVNDWVKKKNQVWKTYFDMLNKSNDHITIMCSYFLPGNIFRKHIIKARKRGVKIKLILAGVSDVPIAKHAERYLYHWMLTNGIEIYEYQPTVLHAKLAVADSKHMTIGSFNVNNISTYASVELNLDVQNHDFVQTVEERLWYIEKTYCKKVTKENFAMITNPFRRFLQLCSYQAIKFILFAFTFYFRQEE